MVLRSLPLIECFYFGQFHSIFILQFGKVHLIVNIHSGQSIFIHYFVLNPLLFFCEDQGDNFCDDLHFEYFCQKRLKSSLAHSADETSKVGQIWLIINIMIKCIWPLKTLLHKDKLTLIVHIGACLLLQIKSSCMLERRMNVIYQ